MIRFQQNHKNTFMRIPITFFFFFMAFIQGALAQNSGTVSGRISADKEASIEAASIVLLKGGDTTFKKQTLSKKDGTFLFENIGIGRYRVAVTLVGYAKSLSAPFEISASNPAIQLPPIALQRDAKALSGVTVTATRPMVEQKVDRTVVNVEAAITNAGANALEVLEKAPGVTVDKDGNISLKGKEGVMVLVDGRPTQLSGADLANLLRNMNAAQMDQVEIMTNPPARFDAAGNAGVINIKTKKTNTVGYAGALNLNYMQGFYPKVNESFNMTYRQGKVALMTNLSHNYRKVFNNLAIQRYLRDEATLEVENYFDQESHRINSGNGYNARVGLDYFASKKTTLGFMLNGFYNTLQQDNTNETNISSAAKQLQSITQGSANTSNTWKNFSTNLYARRVLDTTGRELTADLDFATYSSRNNQELINNFYGADGLPFRNSDTLLGLLPQTIRIYSGRMDYLHPLKGGARLEAGVKSSWVTTDNNAIYDSIQNNGRVRDLARSNHFVYTEAIQAAYVNVNKPLSKKLTAQLGLRLEHTLSMGDQRTTGVKFKTPYTQLFPTAYFQYKINKQNNLGLNYGRRLRRPDYESLNPFIRFIDRYTYSQGNPELKPQFSHNIELTHTYKNFLTTTANYTTTNNIIQSVIEQKGDAAYQRSANIASMKQYGLSVSANKAFTKWWTSSLYAQVYNNQYQGFVNSAAIDFSATTFAFNGSQQFKLGKKTTAEISGMYRTAGLEGVILFRSRGMVSGGISQQILKNKGTLRLTVRDIFHTQRGKASSQYGNVDMTMQQWGDTRVVGLGFSYRFSKGKVATQKRRTDGSAGEEQSRIGID
jgi:iron complex outermembrane recepter protein